MDITNKPPVKIPQKEFYDLADLLRYCRRYRGMTQKEVAAKLGFSYQQYQKYEYGIYTPKKVNREKIAKALKIDVRMLQALAS